MRRVAVAVIAVLSAGAARAQFVQYIQPGSLAVEQTPTKDLVEAAMEDSQFHLGALRLGPWFALKDVGYLNNVYGTDTNQKSDYTATFGAGLQAYLPVGPKLIVGAYALPEYVWWRDLANRRGWNGRYGAGVFGYFNRLTLELKAGVSRQQQYPSNEVEVPANVEDQGGSALVEVRVSGPFSLFARGSVHRWRYNDRGLDPSLSSSLYQIERNETTAAGGVRWHFSKALSVGVGVERIVTDFIHPENNLSNSGTAPLIEVNLTGGRMTVNASAIVLDQHPKDSSGFVPYRGTMGRFRIGYPLGRLSLAVYGARDLGYGVYTAGSYSISERLGFSAGMELGWRSSLSAFVESGRDNYSGGPAVGAGRTDDDTSYGAAFGMKLGRLVSLSVSGSRIDYTSSFAGFGRSVTQITTSLGFSGGKGAWW